MENLLFIHFDDENAVLSLNAPISNAPATNSEMQRIVPVPAARPK